MTFLESHAPLVLVFLLSIIIGLLMVVVFRYTSNQKAIRIAKDHLKAHLLAVRLFQDQLQVVLISYWRILRSTGSYLRLAFMPLLYVSVPDQASLRLPAGLSLTAPAVHVPAQNEIIWRVLAATEGRRDLEIETG